MTLEQLDRTVFELLRIALVSDGLLPSYDGLILPDGSLDAVAWQTALDGFNADRLVNLFGVGVSSNRSSKAGNRIVINRMPRIKGQLGGNTPYFESTGTVEAPTWDKKKKAMTSYHIPYEIRTVCATVAMERTLVTIITDLFGAQSYINLYKPAPNINREFGDEVLFFTWTGSADIRSTELLEQVHNYTFADAWIEKDKTERVAVKPITKIKTEIKDLDRYPDRSVSSVDEVIID